MSNILSPGQIAEILARAINPGPENVSSACTGQCGDIPALAESHEALRDLLSREVTGQGEMADALGFDHSKSYIIQCADMRAELAALNATVAGAPHAFDCRSRVHSNPKIIQRSCDCWKIEGEPMSKTKVTPSCGNVFEDIGLSSPKLRLEISDLRIENSVLRAKVAELGEQLEHDRGQPLAPDNPAWHVVTDEETGQSARRECGNATETPNA